MNLPVSRSLFRAASGQRRSLLGACLAHALHDGYTDLLYVVLPLWQREFGLSYAGLALIRCLYSGTMGGLQIPANRLTLGLGGRRTLTWGTVIAAGGFLLMGFPAGLAVLCAGLTLAGLGASVQHPKASLLVSQAYGAAARHPLGLYNFAGDLGKSLFPPLVSLLLVMMPWRGALLIMAAVGLGVAAFLPVLLPRRPVMAPAARSETAAAGGRAGFSLLLAIGALDTATRMGFLLFLPFLLHGKGGAGPAIGFGFAALFGGGAFGKAACGWLGARLGIVACVVSTELATTVLIVAVVALPLVPAMAVLPLLGVVLNGTSSVLYGTVPELAPRGDAGRAFAIFYTAVIGSGAAAPILYGLIGDHAGQVPGVLAAAATALATIPLVLALRRTLRA